MKGLLYGVGAALVLGMTGLAIEYRAGAVEPPEAVNDFTSPAAQLPANDQGAVLSKIHQTNLMEIQAGELAMQKGYSSLVRAYGDRIARDHRMADAMVLQTADHLGVAVKPTALVASLKMNSLENSYGESFDRAYMAMMVNGHLDDIAALSAEYAKQPAGTTLQNFLGKLLPILKQHLQVAQNIQLWI